MASTDLATILDPSNPAVQTYRQQAPELLAVADGLVIDSEDGLQEAAKYTQTATAACRAIKKLFKPAKDALLEAKRQVDGLEKSLLDGFERADAILRRKVTDYNNERQRRAREEQRIREEAERKAREDALIAQAAALENMARQTGDPHYQKAAEQTLNIPIRTPTVRVEVPKVQGLTFREETGVNVSDFGALIAAVAAGQVDQQALMPNVPWLRNEAKQRGTAVKDGDQLFPGVLVTKTSDVTVRTR